MSTRNQELARDWFDEIWNKRRREAIAERAHPSVLLHECGQDQQGTAAFFALYDRLFAAFSDMETTVHDVLGEGDAVCVRWSATMRHTGDGLGFPPSGRDVSTTGITIMRFDQGLLVEGWQNWDMLGLIEQLGVRGNTVVSNQWVRKNEDLSFIRWIRQGLGIADHTYQ